MVSTIEMRGTGTPRTALALPRRRRLRLRRRRQVVQDPCNPSKPATDTTAATTAPAHRYRYRRAMILPSTATATAAALLLAAAAHAVPSEANGDGPRDQSSFFSSSLPSLRFPHDEDDRGDEISSSCPSLPPLFLPPDACNATTTTCSSIADSGGILGSRADYHDAPPSPSTLKSWLPLLLPSYSWIGRRGSTRSSSGSSGSGTTSAAESAIAADAFGAAGGGGSAVVGQCLDDIAAASSSSLSLSLSFASGSSGYNDDYNDDSYSNGKYSNEDDDKYSKDDVGPYRGIGDYHYPDDDDDGDTKKDDDEASSAKVEVDEATSPPSPSTASASAPAPAPTRGASSPAVVVGINSHVLVKVDVSIIDPSSRPCYDDYRAKDDGGSSSGWAVALEEVVSFSGGSWNRGGDDDGDDNNVQGSNDDRMIRLHRRIYPKFDDADCRVVTDGIVGHASAAFVLPLDRLVRSYDGDDEDREHSTNINGGKKEAVLRASLIELSSSTTGTMKRDVNYDGVDDDAGGGDGIGGGRVAMARLITVPRCTAALGTPSLSSKACSPVVTIGMNGTVVVGSSDDKLVGMTSTGAAAGGGKYRYIWNAVLVMWIAIGIHVVVSMRTDDSCDGSTEGEACLEFSEHRGGGDHWALSECAVQVQDQNWAEESDHWNDNDGALSQPLSQLRVEDGNEETALSPPRVCRPYPLGRFCSKCGDEPINEPGASDPLSHEGNADDRSSCPTDSTPSSGPTPVSATKVKSAAIMMSIQPSPSPSESESNAVAIREDRAQPSSQSEAQLNPFHVPSREAHQDNHKTEGSLDEGMPAGKSQSAVMPSASEVGSDTGASRPGSVLGLPDGSDNVSPSKGGHVSLTGGNGMRVDVSPPETAIDSLGSSSSPLSIEAHLKKKHRSLSPSSQSLACPVSNYCRNFIRSPSERSKSSSIRGECGVTVIGEGAKSREPRRHPRPLPSPFDHSGRRRSKESSSSLSAKPRKAKKARLETKPLPRVVPSKDLVTFSEKMEDSGCKFDVMAGNEARGPSSHTSASSSSKMLLAGTRGRLSKTGSSSSSTITTTSESSRSSGRDKRDLPMNNIVTAKMKKQRRN